MNLNALDIYPAAVTRVIDGDTLEANLHLGLGITFGDITIRLLDIDAPEHGKPAEQATSAVHTWLDLKGNQVLTHIPGGETDSFGRYLAHIAPFNDGGMNDLAGCSEHSITLNQYLLRNDFASYYPHDEHEANRAEAAGALRRHLEDAQKALRSL